MCSRATCNTCGKITWAGCGNHIDQALAGVPQDKLCTCDSAPSTNSVLSRLFAH